MIKVIVRLEDLTTESWTFDSEYEAGLAIIRALKRLGDRSRWTAIEIQTTKGV